MARSKKLPLSCMTSGMAKAKGKPRGRRRDRDCFTCKNRGVKCDLNRPGCSQCLESNQKCAGYPTRVKWSKSVSFDSVRISKHEISKDVQSLKGVEVTRHVVPVVEELYPTSAVSSLPDLRAILNEDEGIFDDSDPYDLTISKQVPEKTEDLSLLFAHVVAKRKDKFSNFFWGIKAIITAFNHSRENNSKFTPSHYDLKKNEILNVSWEFAVNFLANDSRIDSKFRIHCLQLQTSALGILKNCINEEVLEAIFVILTLTYFDVCQGPFGGWHQHLKGARSLLDVHCPNSLLLSQAIVRTPGLQDALTLLIWYDITSSLLEQSRLPVFEDWHRLEIDDNFFKLIGCSRDTFSMLVDICCNRDSIFSNTWILTSLNNVLQSCDKLEGYENVAKNGWESTCLLLALQLGLNATYTQPIIQTLVDKICDNMALLPEDSSYYLHFALPVFIAGMNSKSVKQRDLIRSYWRFWETVTFPIYNGTLERCEQRWQEMDDIMVAPVGDSGLVGS